VTTKTAKTTKATTKTGKTWGRPVGAGGGKAPALSAVEVRALRGQIASEPNAARNLALVNLLLCGLRVSEPLSLRVRDVTDRFGRVTETFVLTSNNTKSGRARRCYVNEAAKKSLATWLAEMPNAGDGEALVFPLNAAYASTLVNTLMKRAGLPGTSHSFRRTAATTLCESGTSPRVIQELLGHTSLSTTQHYLETSTAKVQAAVVNNLNW
jgi:integrase/recombinase XerD